MTAIDSCPGCGYPKFGPDLCDYCQPVLALALSASALAAAPPRHALSGSLETSASAIKAS